MSGIKTKLSSFIDILCHKMSTGTKNDTKYKTEINIFASWRELHTVMPDTIKWLFSFMEPTSYIVYDISRRTYDHLTNTHSEYFKVNPHRIGIYDREGMVQIDKLLYLKDNNDYTGDKVSILIPIPSDVVKMCTNYTYSMLDNNINCKKYDITKMGSICGMYLEDRIYKRASTLPKMEIGMGIRPENTTVLNYATYVICNELEERIFDDMVDKEYFHKDKLRKELEYIIKTNLLSVGALPFNKLIEYMDE